MRTRIGVALAVVALALGGSLATAGAAGAAGVHTVTVTPSSGLSDGQTVTVSGTGFVETPIVNDWSVAMCDPSILSSTSFETAIAHCDITTQPFVFLHADSSGAVSTPYAVRKSFTIEGGATVTCGQAPNDCAILVGQLTDQGFVGAAAPISFGPRTVAACYREFAHDRQHGLRFRLTHLLACVIAALSHRHPS
jgi:Neocarzinostatin family